jgi:L-serine dehydratase
MGVADGEAQCDVHHAHHVLLRGIMRSTVSAFDMFKVGIGPSSSHTLGPWRITQRFVREARKAGLIAEGCRLQVELLGSLALTGRGHATDKAVCLALLGHEPDTVAVDQVPTHLAALRERKQVVLDGVVVPFDPATDIAWCRTERHPGHANAMRCTLTSGDQQLQRVYFSLGGGFIAGAHDTGTGDEAPLAPPPRPVSSGADLLRHCADTGWPIWQVVRDNERTWHDDVWMQAEAARIWAVMREAARRGCRIEGQLPGGLSVTRRAPGLLRDIVPDLQREDIAQLVQTIRDARLPFAHLVRVVSCFAIAVNEENAAMGRVVTAPTNGAAGVIPAVLLYRACFGQVPLSDDEVLQFLLTAGQIGALFQLNATISAAMGGCQAEIGVSSAMAAAGLAELQGASPGQVLMAAEIAMEHHLGMTCDPVGGLVQVPCIERNAMGAIKAIAAATLAEQSDPSRARVSLDEVIEAMWDTAEQMSDRYKETALGGLAVKLKLPVSFADC